MAAATACPKCDAPLVPHSISCSSCDWISPRTYSGSWTNRIAAAIFFLVSVLLSIGLALYGFDHLTVATEGVGFIALAIWVDIGLRIFQAGQHHDQLVETIKIAMAQRANSSTR